MRVDFSRLPPEEIMLLDALEGLCGQYFLDPVAIKSEPIIKAYGLWVEQPEHEINAFAALQEVAKAHKLNVGYWMPGRSQWLGDRSTLNERAEILLLALAGTAYGCLTFEHEGRQLLEHVSMQAGEAACFQLAAYSLIDPDPGGGYWNEAGQKAASFAMSKDFPCLDRFTFEDLT